MATATLSRDHGAIDEPPPTDPPPIDPPPIDSDGGRPSRVRRIIRGRSEDPTWIRPALLVLLVGTTALYLYNLNASGYANSFYSAAVQAGSDSWKAFFFGSSDAANSITVDKPPAALWIMALSVRVFGLSSWSILVPEVLMGVCSVALLYLAVRRWHGPQAGLLAGAALALTPVSALMFRFNNPDALLVLLMTFAAYATVRAIEKASPRWLMAVGILIGFGFLTKMLQALLVVPAFAIAYLIAAPTPLRKRLLHLLAAGAAMVVSAGWWIAIVELVPASMRPYIGGSQENSILELTLGYNGLGRITGEQTGSVGGSGGWGETGVGRLFNSEMGGQIAWLLPAALLMTVVGLMMAGRAPRTDRVRASYLLWGGWLLVTAAVFSFMAGIFHAYYTVALAPAVAALVGIGTAALWAERRRLWASAVLAATLAMTGVWSFVLLGRSSDFLPWLRWTVLISGVVISVVLVLAGRIGNSRVRGLLATAAIVVGLAGPAAYTVQTVGTAHTGSIVTAGPTVGGGQGFGGAPGGTRAGGGPGNGVPPAGGGPGGVPPGGTPNATPGATTNAAGVPGRGGGGAGLLSSTEPSAQLQELLQSDAGDYTWVAAAVGSQNALGYQLATELPVMAVGGFNGSDPSPTLAQFQAYVEAGDIHYFIGGGGGMGQQNGGSNASAEIAAWVADNFTAQTVDGVTIYDLS